MCVCASEAATLASSRMQSGPISSSAEQEVTRSTWRSPQTTSVSTAGHKSYVWEPCSQHALVIALKQERLKKKKLWASTQNKTQSGHPLQGSLTNNKLTNWLQTQCSPLQLPAAAAALSLTHLGQSYLTKLLWGGHSSWKSAALGPDIQLLKLICK